MVSGAMAPPAWVRYRSAGNDIVETSTWRRMISNVSGTPANPVHRSASIVASATRGNANRFSRNTDPPAHRWVCSTLRP